MTIASLALGFASSAHAAANTQNRYASIIIDADSLEILHARKIDESRYPASLTKMMTLYLTFDALSRGELSLDEKLPISAHASRTPPVRLGLKAGASITVEQAIYALVVRSANDASVVLAERLGGSQREFAVLMSAKAKALGMQATIFANPHGLPDEGQLTTARDMAKLAEALLRNHRVYYPYFSTKSFRYQGRTYTNHNTLLGRVDGVDGFKTGFTNASGYNLVLSARRDGRRIIAVVLGGASGRSRDKHMADLIERGFEVLKQASQIGAKTGAKAGGQIAALNADERRRTIRTLPPTDRLQAYTLRAGSEAAQDTVRIIQGANGMLIAAVSDNTAWAAQIGAYASSRAAQAALAGIVVENGQPQIIPVQRESGFIYRARLAGMSKPQAQKLCKSLADQGQSCLVIAPQ